MDQDIVNRNKFRMVRLGIRLQSAKVQLQNSFPLRVDSFDPDQIDDELLLRLDGFRVRFADLQDILGQVMFPLICRFDEDESVAQPLSTRERIVLIEKKGLINREQWRLLREIRNSFTHEYPDENEEKAFLLNQAWNNSDSLIKIVADIESYLVNPSL